MPNKYNSYNGKTFAGWRIDEFSRIKTHKYTNRQVFTPMVLATCLVCGKQKELQLYSITRGYSKGCRSCSSKGQEIHLPPTLCGDKNSRWTGEGVIPGHLIGRIKEGARVRGLSYNLPVGFLSDKWNEQHGICAVSGAELIIPSSKVKKEISPDRRARFASLDRIDSSKGYEKENVQWVTKTVNLMKQTLSTKEFLFWINKIHEFNSRGAKPGTGLPRGR